MAKTWILHTETKGTGAQMVPLETVTKRSDSVEPVFVPRKAPRPAEPQPPSDTTPRRFRIVDVMTRLPVLADGSPRQAIDALKDVRSVVDVDVCVWHEERRRWRRLTFAEQRALLELAHS